MAVTLPPGPLCGLSIDRSSRLHLCVATPQGGREAHVVEGWQPFCWSCGAPGDGTGAASVQALDGPNPYDHLLRFDGVKTFYDYARSSEARARGVESIRPLESQFLLDVQGRLFDGLRFDELIRVQLDIETACGREDGFSNADEPDDRVLAIGLRREHGGVVEEKLMLLEARSDEAEKQLLFKLNAMLAKWDPDIIEGHNLFNFDLSYLQKRGKRLRVPPAWGRFGKKASFRSSRIRFAERWVDFLRCDIPGRAVFDTYLAIQVYDVTTRELPAYGLKDVAVYLGITTEDDGRTYLGAGAIEEAFGRDRAAFEAYLKDDLRETAGIAAFLLPTYVAQARGFPMPLQEICLRGTAAKVDQLLVEKYHAAGHSLPRPPEIGAYEGGYTKSFRTGVFRQVLHYDVASLYPSLLLSIGRGPATDTLGVFLPLLRELRAERLRYKKLAKDAPDETERRESAARQAAYKILINSFYGYLGFGGGRFADGELAAEVTRRGRELLQSLIARFEELGCPVLEADTDGLYISADEVHWKDPQKLLEDVRDVLPEGIDLEFGGHYEAMFCYKAKNYALYDGEKVTYRGSALRSRGLEPFLKGLTDHLIAYLLGAAKESPAVVEKQLRREIESGEIDVARLAKSENLSMSPEAYRKALDEGKKKPRRASLEVALTLSPRPRMGERVAYYLTKAEKKSTPDWKKARALALYDGEEAPYDPAAYLKKLDDWVKRYSEFLPELQQSAQEEMF